MSHMSIVYNVPSTGRLLGHLKQHNFIILSTYLTHIWTEWAPGCSFLSATMHVPVTVNSLTENQSDIIIDSGSDITLISMKTLNALLEILKKCTMATSLLPVYRILFSL